MRMKPFLGLMLEPPLPFLSAHWCNLMRKKNIVIVAHQLYNFHHNFRHCFIGHPTYCKIWEFPVLCKTEFSPSPCPWSPAVEVFPVHCHHHPHHCHAHNDDDVADIDVVYDGGNGDYVVDDVDGDLFFCLFPALGGFLFLLTIVPTGHLRHRLKKKHVEDLCENDDEDDDDDDDVKFQMKIMTLFSPASSSWASSFWGRFLFGPQQQLKSEDGYDFAFYKRISFISSFCPWGAQAMPVNLDFFSKDKLKSLMLLFHKNIATVPWAAMKAWCHGGMETWHGMVASTLMSCYQQLVAHPTSVSRHQFVFCCITGWLQWHLCLWRW